MPISFELDGHGDTSLVVTPLPQNPESAVYGLDAGLSNVVVLASAFRTLSLEFDTTGSANIVASVPPPTPQSASYGLGVGSSVVALDAVAPKTVSLEIDGHGDAAFTVDSNQNSDSGAYGLDSGTSSVTVLTSASKVISLEFDTYGFVTSMQVTGNTSPASGSYGLDPSASSVAVVAQPGNTIGFRIEEYDPSVDGLTAANLQVTGGVQNLADGSYGLDPSQSSVAATLFVPGTVSLGFDSDNAPLDGRTAVVLTVLAEVVLEIAPCGDAVLLSDTVEYEVEPCGDVSVSGVSLGSFEIAPCGVASLYNAEYDPEFEIAPCGHIILVASRPIGELPGDGDVCANTSFKSAALAVNVFEYIFGTAPVASGPAAFYVTFAGADGSEVAGVPRTMVPAGPANWQRYIGGLECGDEVVNGHAGIQTVQEIVIGPFATSTGVRYLSIWDDPFVGNELYRMRTEKDITFAAGASATIPAGALRMGGEYIV